MCNDHHHPTGLDRRSLMMAGAGITTAAALVAVPSASAADVETISFSGRFTGIAMPDWHYLPVRVPEGVNAIEVSYDYSPLETGLGFSANVVDIGIFDPEGFRGWSGGARRSFRVATDGATEGYLAGPIDAGEWRVALGPFAVIPPGVEYAVRVTLHVGPAGVTPAATPPPRAVSDTGPGWYRGDLHLHTVHSDGRHTQASLVELARAAGLDFIGSAEHNTSSAPLTWGEHVTADRPPLVICGEEVTTRNGHWLAMGVPAGTWVDWRYRDRAGLARQADLVRGLGGLAVACHPWAPTPGSLWGFGYDFRQVDAIEIWNGPWTIDDQVGVKIWHAALVARRFVPVVGSSDSHHSGQTVGEAQTVVRAETLSVPAVTAGLRAGRSWIAESSKVGLRFEATARGRTASCGESLGARPGDLVDVHLEVTGAPGCAAVVVGPVLPVAFGLTDDEGQAVVTAKVPALLAPFVRAEVRRLDGQPVVNPLEGVLGLAMVAMTNPIRLSGSWASPRA